MSLEMLFSGTEVASLPSVAMVATYVKGTGLSELEQNFINHPLLFINHPQGEEDQGSFSSRGSLGAIHDYTAV